ncbi:MAG: TIM barrel protein [Thermogutta sp.]|jgi:sugar phosphate isomerase/epimerase
MAKLSRRDFLRRTLGVPIAAAAVGHPLAWAFSGEDSSRTIRLGLVTYLWGRDWDLPTLLANCEKTGMEGVELRTEHAHGVEPEIGPEKRAEVRKRFADSPVVLVGLGSNEAFHYPEPERLKQSIERTKAFIKLSHDVGGLGVKVKPNDLPKQVPQEKTIEQIGRALNELAAFAADYGQRLRLEVHGQCAPLPIMRKIMDVATHPNVGLCWNSNAEDLQGQGLEYNFNLVKDRLGDTVHVRELNLGDYPYQTLFNLLVANNYKGWILLECRTNPPDRIAALIEQRRVWEEMMANARKAA